MGERSAMKAHQLFIAVAMLLVPGPGPAASISSIETKTVVEGTEFSAQTRQRPRVRVYRDRPAAFDYPRPDDYSWPGPGAVRQCVDWYATEYRPSGTVVTPQMRCRLG
jgi:hypothetical protein